MIVAHDQLDSPVLLKEDISYVNSHGIFVVVIPFKSGREVIVILQSSEYPKSETDAQQPSNADSNSKEKSILPRLLARIPSHKSKGIETFCH